MPVVGIGASAGGLDALKTFFKSMPADSGMAFVIIQHLEPTHESRLADILGKWASMNVMQANDGILVQPNRVYANIAGKSLGIEKGRLRLSESVKSEGIRKPIDFFFESLAEDQQEKAIGIILSGSSGSDGPRGCRAVRAAGGMCMAQDPKTAQYPAMPQSAIDTGLMDFVLPVNQMPQALIEYVRHAQVQAADRGNLPPTVASEDLEAILKLLRLVTDSDYHHYKKTTIIRRIQRRMGLRQIAEFADYLKYLRVNPEELKQLSKDMLIGVSSFFRDPEAFEELRRRAIIPLVAGKEPDDSVRCWVPGCATGEEAYTIAILLLETMAAAGKNCPVQIFASDVDEHALEVARTGVYPESITEDVPAKYLTSYFTHENRTYQVGRRLREAVIFSRQNLLVDPPFSKLDLISCRNVLIYLESEAQKRVLTLFSFALKVGGYLFMGKSEGVSGKDDLYEAISRPRRIYRLIQTDRRAVVELPLYAGARGGGLASRERTQSYAVALAQANQEVLLRHYGASVVLIDPRGQILYFYGQTEKYLGHPKGLATLNLLEMTAGVLSAKLRRAIEEAMRQDEPVTLKRVPPSHEGAPPANLTVMRVQIPSNGDRCLAVIFEDATEKRPPAPVAAEADHNESLVSHLEDEVNALRSELQANAEEYDSASEELKTANEEVMSMNEELQSANEELEASKEELQSLNEELTTVNSQLNEKVSELTTANNDLANLFNASEIATIFLDGQLQIKRFTPQATELLNLIPSDLGRPVTHITQKYAGKDLATSAAKALHNLTATEEEVQAVDGRWYIVRILPYRTLDNRIDGVVITFTDVTRLKIAERQLQDEKAYAENIVQMVPVPLLVLDKNLRILSANSAYYQLFQSSSTETVGRRMYELEGLWDNTTLRRLFEETISRNGSFQEIEVEHNHPRIGRRTLVLSGSRIQPAGSPFECILLIIVDITERKRDREALSQRAGQLRQLTARLAAQLTRSEQRERERVARVLHDNLQQLLVGAKFHLGAMRNHCTAPALIESMDTIEGLLDQALGVSKSLTTELSPTILYESGLEGALPWLAHQFQEKFGLEIEVDVQAAVPRDDEGIVVMLFNATRELLFNVVKHAGVKKARVQSGRLDNNQIQVVVSDDGIGFDPTAVRKAETDRTRLGLIGICERIDSLGGLCTIDSAPGRGTRVTLVAPVLPSRIAAEGEEAPPSAGAAPVDATAGSTRRIIRVLLADDHVIVRQGVAGILRQESDIDIVAEAGDGAEALAMTLLHRPDVVVMDVGMPGMNGVEATQKIVAELPGTRVIGLSMHTRDERAEAMIAAGAIAYLSKDGPPEDLVEAIRRCVTPSPGKPTDRAEP
ncbi:MAG: PAS domain-containing protein [bacterium]|nr:PAS domain-containing protein [bacterium]